MTLDKVVTVYTTLKKVLPYTSEYGARTSYLCSRIYKAFEIEYDTFYSTAVDIYKKYGVEEDDKKYHIRNKAKQKQAQEELNDLLQTEVEIVFKPLELELKDSLPLSAQDILLLEGVFNFKVEE
jgi:hypothetical protein